MWSRISVRLRCMWFPHERMLTRGGQDQRHSCQAGGSATTTTAHGIFLGGLSVRSVIDPPLRWSCLDHHVLNETIDAWKAGQRLDWDQMRVNEHEIEQFFSSREFPQDWDLWDFRINKCVINIFFCAKIFARLWIVSFPHERTRDKCFFYARISARLWIVSFPHEHTSGIFFLRDNILSVCSSSNPTPLHRVQGLSVELTEGADLLFDGFYAESPTAHFSSLLGYYGFSC